MDRQGKLSSSELLTIKEGLATKLKAPCWNCGEQDWLIFPTVIGEAFYDAEGQFMTSAYLAPKVRITCRNCGNIVYFSAESMGLNTEPTDG